MSSKRPAWVDDLEAFLREHGACSSSRRRALRYAGRFKTFQEAWKTWNYWWDLQWFFDQIDPSHRRWGHAKTLKSNRYQYEISAILRGGLSSRAESRALCAMRRRFWPNPPKLPKAKPIKKGR